MAVLDLEPVRADVVLGLAELADDLEVVQAGLLAGLPQRGGLRGLPGADAAGRDLDADLLVAVIGVPEHQQPPVAHDVDEHLLLGDLLGHRNNLHMVGNDRPELAEQRLRSPWPADGGGVGEPTSLEP